jgi:hypothetical protein
MRAGPKKAKPKRVRRGYSETLRPEYDFSRGVRGKHAARYAAGTNVVILDHDVASVFPTAVEVNEALRALAQLIRQRESLAHQLRPNQQRAAGTKKRHG